MDKCSGFDLSLATVFGKDALSEAIRGKLREVVGLLLDAEVETVLAAARYARVDQRAGYEADNLEGAQAARRKFVGKWRRDLPKVVASLEEAGDELLTFYRYPREQWKRLRTTNPIERLNGEFKRRVKTQCSLPSQESALLLLFGLIVSGQIRLRKIDGGRKIAEVVNERRGIESTKRAS